MINVLFLTLLTIFVVGPAGMFLVNLLLYRSLRLQPDQPPVAVSVLIPARNEQANIENCLRSVLGNENVILEVVVLDDHSTDNTAAIVRQLAKRDHRLRLEHAPTLPDGWCGKQHACHTLAGFASHPLMVFMDADVQLAADSLARMAGYIRQSGASLISGVPHQQTETWLEKLLIPQIHFILLSYLPMWIMRRSIDPAYGAGCGQLFMAKRDDYRQAGGHATIRRSLHDGVMLPRAFRRAGFRTDLFDATDVATCRMYHSARDVWAGLCKNAREGMATPRALLIWTPLLLAQTITPLLAVFWLLQGVTGWLAALYVLSLLLPVFVRCVQSIRFSQSIVSALFHPLGIMLLLTIQWWSLIRDQLGYPSQWRGRVYPTTQA